MTLTSSSTDLEQLFREWSKPPTTTEESKCENALSVVRNAISASDALTSRGVSVFAQGSYRNGTNVRADSDVDVCVCCTHLINAQLPEHVSFADVGLVDTSYSITQFKNEVVKALVDYLGAAAVKRGNKCIDLHANTYRVDADVVPTITHRRYFLNRFSKLDYHEGTLLRPDRGASIRNWPEQNYRNGTDKNNRTRTRFKKLVRVMKRLRNRMATDGVPSAQPIASFLVECLVWNVPDENFESEYYVDNFREILSFLYDATEFTTTCKDWGEVNELKYLFSSAQSWTRRQVRRFLEDAWDYVGSL